MKGTEKQVAWAEEIKENYIESINSYKDYLGKVAEKGTTKIYDDDHNFQKVGEIFVNAYHPEALYETVKDDMKSSDLYKAFRASERGSQERKALGKEFRSAVAYEAISRLTDASEKQSSEESAAWWIEHRMK